MITPYNLLRHELTGLKVRVVDASHDGYRVDGIVSGETRNTITITKEDREYKIPKKDVTLEFTLPEGAVVQVEGSLLVSRPEDRVKKKIKKRF
ncbi:MAG: ribonuclease P protein component 1 [Candidatus Altiarchaeota archaeon]